jgi:predicted nucleotidyltransferase
MPVSPEDTARHLAELEDRRSERARQRASALIERLPEARDVITKLGAQRAWLFGSLATGRVTETSDVDLAVEGLPSEVYFTAVAELMAVFRGPVDLVRLEEAAPSLRDRILVEGRAL